MKPLLPLPNLRSPLAKISGGFAYLIDPWNSFFMQLVQVAPTAVPVTGPSPLSYTANTKGNLLVIGGTISNISLIRGTDTFNLTGQRIIPISIGDTVTITYSVAPAMNFLGV